MWLFTSHFEYRTLNKVVINSAALAANFKVIAAFHPEARICPVLKSNAYGHGLKEVAPIFDALKPAFLVVDSLFEAYELSKTGTKSPILITGYTHPDNFKVKRLPFSFALFDLETAAVLDHYQPGAKVHIFVDTGMNREGVRVSELPDFLAKIKKLKHLKVEGLCSHFADADNPQNDDLNQSQLQHFKQALEILKEAELTPKWVHISASAGSFKYADPMFTMLRVGIASYGISALEPQDKAADKIKLQPALSFYSTLAQIKKINKGEVIGYGATFKAKNDLTVGLLPAGYYEGVDRRLSNKGMVKLRNVFCPILGRVSMNMTTIDISQVKDAQVGDEVCIYSADANDENSVAKAAQTAGTIPYELLVHLAESVKREVI